MIQLPDTAIVGLLALRLGGLLGGGGYHLLSPDAGQVPLEGRTQILEPGRFLQPADTSSQSTPDRKIRYRTRRDTVLDTLFVPIPSQVGSEIGSPSLVEEQPLEVSSGRVTLTRWDVSDRRWVQDIYTVPDQRFESRLYGLVRIRNPPQLGLQAPTRIGVGLGAELRYRSVRARLESTLSLRLQPTVEAALVWDF